MHFRLCVEVSFGKTFNPKLLPVFELAPWMVVWEWVDEMTFYKSASYNTEVCLLGGAV